MTIMFTMIHKYLLIDCVDIWYLLKLNAINIDFTPKLLVLQLVVTGYLSKAPYIEWLYFSTSKKTN